MKAADSPMKTIHLTVNREPHEATVAARTQLAELLRDHLQPHRHPSRLRARGVRRVHGARERASDPLLHHLRARLRGRRRGHRRRPGRRSGREALRDAFVRHHALQCGFCTPGMLITAWDVVTRLAPVDDAAIRRELNGNLCRCTGYMGIVAAVQEVARQRRGEGPADANGVAEARECLGAPAASSESSGTGAVGAGEATDRDHRRAVHRVLRSRYGPSRHGCGRCRRNDRSGLHHTLRRGSPRIRRSLRTLRGRSGSPAGRGHARGRRGPCGNPGGRLDPARTRIHRGAARRCAVGAVRGSATGRALHPGGERRIGRRGPLHRPGRDPLRSHRRRLRWRGDP